MPTTAEILAASRARLSGESIAVGRDPDRPGRQQYMPGREVASRLARLQNVPGTREQGLSLQRQFQDGISDEDLASYGLTRIKRKSPSLVQRGGGALFGALDILDRPSQAVIRGFGGIFGKGGDNAFSGFFGGLTGRGERLSFTDALGAPDNALGNFLGTVATDPLTYLTFGTSSAAKRALLSVSEELGQGVAEQVARRGLGALKDADVIAMAAKGNGRAAKTAGDDLMGTLRKMDEFADGQLDKIAGEIQGGIKVGAPFKGGKTAVPGERFRAPLRGSTAPGRRRALMDPIRPGVRSGSILRGTESAIDAPIRAAIRANSGVRAVREGFQVAGNASSALGKGILNRFGAAGGRAAASVGNVEEVIAKNAEVLRKADIDEDLKVRIMAASERSAKPGGTLDLYNVEAETLGDIFAEHVIKGTPEAIKIADAITAVSNTRTRSRVARMTPTGRQGVVRDAQMRWSTAEPIGPETPGRIRTLGNQEPTTTNLRRRRLRGPGERVNSYGETILDDVSRKRADELYTAEQQAGRDAAEKEAIELEVEYERLMGQHRSIEAPPQFKSKGTDKGGDRKRRVPKFDGGPSVTGGEWDWWWDLSKAEKDALKREGRVGTRPGKKRGLSKKKLEEHRSGGALDDAAPPPAAGKVADAAAPIGSGADDVAYQVSRVLGLENSPVDPMDHWLDLTRRIRDAKARARAAPRGATHEEFSDDIARRLLDEEDDGLLKSLQYELGDPAVYGKNVWDMEFDEVLAELKKLEDALKKVEGDIVDDGFEKVYPDGYRELAARHDELWRPFAGLPWEHMEPKHGRLKVLATQTSKRARMSAGGESNAVRIKTAGSAGRVPESGPVPRPAKPQVPSDRPDLPLGDGRFTEPRYATTDNDGVVGAANDSFSSDNLIPEIDPVTGKALPTGSLGMADVVPREMTLEGRRAVKGNSALKARVDALPAKPIHELNKQIQEEIHGLEKIDEFFETDPLKIAQIQYVHNSRQLARKQYLDELETIGDPSRRSKLYPDGEPLVMVNRGGVNEATLAGSGDVKRVQVAMDGQEVWVHPELEPVVKRMDEQFFNPEVQGKFVQAFDDILGMWKGLATVPIWFGIGFHARNMIGNIRLNSIEGVKAVSYRDALGAQKIIEKAVQRAKKSSLMDDSSIKAIIKGTDADDIKKSRLSSAFDSGNRMDFEDALWEVAAEEGASDELIGRILSARREGVLNSGFFDADLRGRDFIDNLRGSDKQTKWEYIKAQLTDPRESVPIKQGAAIGGMVENNARLAHYFSKLDEGLTITDASASVKRTLFDYSELTDVEKNVFKRIVPFYTFMRKNTPVQLASLMTTPRKFLTERRLLEGIASTEQADDRAIPDWALDGGMVPLPGFMANFLAGGNASVMGALDLPTDAAFETIEPLLEFVAWVLPDAVVPEEFQASRKEFFSGIVGLPGGGVTEGVKLFLEEATETDLFTGAPLDNQGKRQLFERWSNAVPLFSKGRTLLEGVFDVRRTDDPEYVDTVLTIVKNITGANLAAVGPRRERGEILSRIDELDRVLRRARNKYDMPTITQMRAAGLLPDAG